MPCKGHEQAILMGPLPASLPLCLGRVFLVPMNVRMHRVGVFRPIVVMVVATVVIMRMAVIMFVTVGVVVEKRKFLVLARILAA